ncbi:MAG: hypothetical protein HXN10_04195 [Porphyromonadaceae bacterium]|nr:hypothetical protein [Porphyromonadaceae bacterium]
MVHILKQKGALLCALLILLTALPLTAQRKRRATAPLPALPDTVYLLDHYQESRHWMRDPDKISRAKAKRNYKEMINAGWEFLAPAWRGVQDSASYPAFRYYYASMADELRSPANKSRLLAFYVKEEPVERSQEWLRGVKFTPMNRLDQLVDYEKSDVSRLPKQIYIVRVTGDSVRLYSVFHTRCSRGGSDYCVLSIGGAPINPESLQVVGFSDRLAAPGTEGASSVAACEEAFGQCRRLRAHNLTVPWLSYYICYEDGGYHTEDKCDPAYVSSPPSDEEFAANRKRKGITSLPDTIYLLDHYQESRQWSRKSLGDLLEEARKRGPKEMINAGWEFLAPAWRGGQDSAAYPAFRYYYASFDDELYSGANPRLLAFYVKEEPIERSQEWLRGVKFTSMKHLDKLVRDYTYDLRCLPKQIYIVRVTSEGIRVYPVFHTRYCQLNVFGLYYTAPRDAINPEALHPVLLNTRGYIPCAENVPSAVSEEALEQSRRLKKLGLHLEWLSYRTSKEGGRYAVESD